MGQIDAHPLDGFLEIEGVGETIRRGEEHLADHAVFTGTPVFAHGIADIQHSADLVGEEQRGQQHTDDDGGQQPPVGKARMGPADFFIDASEQLGDAAIAQVTQSLGDSTRIDLLEQRLACVLDHEKLHQCLAEAALAVRGGGDEP